MAHQVRWNKIYLEEFIRIGALNQDEEDVLRLRVAGKSIAQQASDLGMSISKVNVVTRHLKEKYDECQPYSNILPVRNA